MGPGRTPAAVASTATPAATSVVWVAAAILAVALAGCLDRTTGAHDGPGGPQGGPTGTASDGPPSGPSSTASKPATTTTSSPSRPAEPAQPEGRSWGPLTALPCTQCFEPSAAWLPDGTLIVATSADLFTSRDGGATFTRSAAPTAFPDRAHGDGLVQVDPQGRLWYSVLSRDDGGFPPRDIELARSVDGGATWTLLAHVEATVPAQQLSFDRQWLAFGPGVVHLVCNCPSAGAVASVAVSRDDGRTFGPLRPIVEATGHFGPPGMPATSPGGALLVPMGGASLPDAHGRLQHQGVLAAVSLDEGRSFQSVVVTAEPVSGWAFPNAAWVDGEFWVAWTHADGTPMTARSPDGLAWSEPTAWGGPALVEGGAMGPLGTTIGNWHPHPWVAQGTSGPVVAWFAANATGRVDSWVADRDGRHLVAVLPDPGTDHAHVAVAADGRIAVPVAGAVRVQQPAPNAG